jgi:hypothetical protein
MSRLTFDQTIGEIEDELEDVLLELRRINREDLRAEHVNGISYRITRINDEWARIMSRKAGDPSRRPLDG